MHRRGFLGRLFGAGAASVALAAPRVAEGTVADLPDVIVVDGRELRWLGWERQPFQDIYIGYWITTQPVREDYRWYASVYGVVREYLIGHVFDATVRYDGTTYGDLVVTAASSQAHRDRLRRQAFDRLVVHLRSLPE